MTLIPLTYGELPAFSHNDLQWLGERVFANECASQFECLTSWNEGEDFPSLGIGHFIWYQAGQDEIFEESFPALIEYYRQENYPLPQWLSELAVIDSPWRSRNEFYQNFDSQAMTELRHFLADSTEIQVGFIVQRMQHSLPSLFSSLSTDEASILESRFYTLANSSSPYGVYALIDYVHFKGSGTKITERYRGQGWGLVQVLQQMKEGEALDAFVRSAAEVLERRVANAPTERREQRWIQGWKNRLTTYLPP